MRRLICVFVVRIWHKQVFSWRGSNKECTKLKWFTVSNVYRKYEPQNDKTNKMTCAPSKDSDQPGHSPSLISLHCPHEETLDPQPLLFAQRRLWSNCADAQAGLSLLRAQVFLLVLLHFRTFVGSIACNLQAVVTEKPPAYLHKETWTTC